MDKAEFLQKYKSNIQKELLEYESQRQGLVFDHILVICGAIVCTIAYFLIAQKYTTIVIKYNKQQTINNK